MLAWYVANTIVRFADALLAFALGWEAANVSGSFVATVGLAHSIPMIAFLLLGGFAADRVGQFQMLRRTWLLTAVTSVIFLGALEMGLSLRVLLVVDAVVSGVITGFRMPSANVFIRLLVPDDQVAKALQRSSTLSGMAALVAPAVAGLLVSAGGLRLVLMLQIALMAAGVAMLSMLWRLRRVPPAAASTPLVDDAARGFRVLMTIPNLAVLLLVLAIVASSILPAVNTLLRLAGVERGGSATGTGYVFSAWSAGSLTVSAIMAVVGARSRPAAPMAAGLFLAAGAMTVLAFTPSVWVGVVATFGIGVGVVLFSAHFVPMSILLSPEGSWSRVSSVVTLVQVVPAAIVGPALAAGSDVVGVDLMLLVSAALGLVAALIVVVHRPLRRATLTPQDAR